MELSPTPSSKLAEHAEVIRALGKRAIADIIEIGRRARGAWQLASVVRARVRVDGEHRAQLRVHELAKSANFADLNVSVSVLYMLAAPSTPPKVRDETR